MTSCQQFDVSFWRDAKGYGRRVRGGVTQFAHRNAVNAPPGSVVRHSCDNPSCVNPLHLAIGTQLQNIADREERGRTAVGLKNGRAKLTPEMISFVKASKKSSRVIARELSVSHTAVQWARRQWTTLSRQTT